MTANSPQPRPGVLDIAPYIPGKSTAPGVAKVFKLSSNETPLGASENAIAAYRAVGEHLEDYPDGAALGVARGDRRGLRPRSGAHRLRRRFATTCSICWRAPISPTATRRSTPRTAFWSIRSPRWAPAPNRSSRRKRISPPTSTPCSQRVTQENQDRVPGQSEQSDRHLRAVRRGQAAAPRRCRQTCCWCSTPPTPNMSAATITNPASSWSPPPTTW